MHQPRWINRDAGASKLQPDSYDLQGALTLVKGTRNRLASSQAEIGEHVAIASQQRQKQALAKMEGTLLKVNQAAALRDQLKCESAILLSCILQQHRSKGSLQD